MEKVPIRLGRLRTSVTEAAPTSLDIRLHPSSTGSDGAQLRTASTGRVCRVCTANEARYTCPRCNLPYCSVACYRTHGESCTEQFYQDHVANEMAFSERATAAVDPKAQRQRETAQLLARVKQFHDETDRAFDDDDPGAEDGDDDVELSVERLAQLALLEDGELSLESLTETEREQFLAAVAGGKMSKYVVPWEPWWCMDAKVYEKETSAKRRKLIIEVVDDAGGTDRLVDSDDDEITDENASDIESAAAAIEAARFPMAIFTRDVECSLPPSMATLVRGAVAPSLPFHFVEILFAYAFTLRTFNGDWAQDPEDAALTVLQCSDVLREDARFATLEEVVIKCLELKDVDGGAPQAATNRLVLADVATMLACTVFALDALTDLAALVGAAADEIARTRLLVDNESTLCNKKTRKSDRAAVRLLRGVEKKLEFYRTWRFHAGGDAANDVSMLLRGKLDSFYDDAVPH